MTYNPNGLIGMASKFMSNYQLPDGVVKTRPKDTGVIVLVALYMMDKDKKVSRTKLEGYMIILNKLCLKKHNIVLFDWDMQGRHIRNINTVTNFMLRKGLIQLKNRSYFELAEAGKDLTSCFATLINIRKWLDDMLKDYKEKTGEQTLAEALNMNIT